MRHRHNDIWDQPWVLIAVVVGVVAVLAIAALVFMGGSGGSSGATSPSLPSAVPTAAQTTTKPVSGSSASSSAASAQTTAAASGASSVTLVPTTAASVPAEGVYIKVSYIGGFSGTYGATGTMAKITSSGDQIYAVNTSLGGPVQASFQKRDGSAKHDLIVEIWKGGKAIVSQKNSSAYGLVSISSPV